MSFFDWAFSLFSYKPTGGDGTPWPDKKSDTCPDIDPDIKYTANKGVANVSEHTSDGFETTIVLSDGDLRSVEITKTDEDVAAERGLSMKRYRILKQYWAKRWSANKTAKYLKDNGKEKGNSLRTLEKYWSAYFEAMRLKTKQNRSPTVKKRSLSK